MFTGKWFRVERHGALMRGWLGHGESSIQQGSNCTQAQGQALVEGIIWKQAWETVRWRGGASFGFVYLVKLLLLICFLTFLTNLSVRVYARRPLDSVFIRDGWHCGSDQSDLPNSLHARRRQSRSITHILVPGSRLGIFEAKLWST